MRWIKLVLQSLGLTMAAVFGIAAMAFGLMYVMGYFSVGDVAIGCAAIAFCGAVLFLASFAQRRSVRQPNA